jgi:hypothetical protein
MASAEIISGVFPSPLIWAPGVSARGGAEELLGSNVFHLAARWGWARWLPGGSSRTAGWRSGATHSDKYRAAGWEYRTLDRR